MIKNKSITIFIIFFIITIISTCQVSDGGGGGTLPIDLQLKQKIMASDAAETDWFGWSVSISGDKAIVGAHRDDLSGYEYGSAYLFHRNGSIWVEKQKITASDGASRDQFGNSVAISGDWTVVGNRKGDVSGSAYIFRWNGSNWVEQQKITASDGHIYNWFGLVAIDGDNIIVGAHAQDGNGATYIFRWNGSTWVECQKITASDGENSDQFGWPVAISGNWIIVGAIEDDDLAGSAYLFRWTGSSWVQQQKIIASDRRDDDQFSRSVSISGDKAIVGAWGNNSRTGAAYLFHWNGTTWVQKQKITASNKEAYDDFGWSVAISGDEVIVGAPRDTGTIYHFSYDGISWDEQKMITVDTPTFFSTRLGQCVAISGDKAIVGADDSEKAPRAGAVYILE